MVRTESAKFAMSYISSDDDSAAENVTTLLLPDPGKGQRSGFTKALGINGHPRSMTSRKEFGSRRADSGLISGMTAGSGALCCVSV